MNIQNQEQQTSQLIKKTIHKKNPDAEVILFGSHARGDAKDDSDWDVLILLNQSEVDRKTEREYQDTLFDLELQIGQPITTYVFAKKDWESRYSITPFYQNILKDGIPL